MCDRDAFDPAAAEGSATIRAERSALLDVVVHDDGLGPPQDFSLEKSDKPGPADQRTLVSAELDGSAVCGTPATWHRCGATGTGRTPTVDAVRAAQAAWAPDGAALCRTESLRPGTGFRVCCDASAPLVFAHASPDA